MGNSFMFEWGPFEAEYEFWNETGELSPEFFEEEWEWEMNSSAQLLNPQMPAYTQCDFIDPRIDVDAQYALYEMLRGDVPTRKAAIGMLAAVKAGKLGGIYKEDQMVPVQYARSMRLGWWQLIDLGGKGQPAACISKEGIVRTRQLLTKTQSDSAPPIIAFRRNLKDRFRLGQALRQAWEACELPELDPYPASGKICPAKPLPPPPKPTIVPNYIGPDITQVKPPYVEPPSCDLTEYVKRKNQCYNDSLGRIANCAMQFGVDESGAIGLAVSVLGTVLAASEIPPLAAIVAIIGGSAAAFLGIRAQWNLASCIYGVLQQYGNCMKSAKDDTHCL